MRKSDLLALGQAAIAKGLFDVRLRAAWNLMNLTSSGREAKAFTSNGYTGNWQKRAEDGFCARTKHLILTGVIEVARPKQAKRRAA